MYLLSQPAGVMVDGPGANSDPALGDGSLKQSFVVGSKSLWAHREIRDI